MMINRTISLIFILLFTLFSQNLLANNKEYFSIEAGVRFNIMLNYRAKTRFLDFTNISSKSTDNFTYFGRFYYNYSIKNNKISFYSGISVQNSAVSFKYFYDYKPSELDIKKYTINYLELLLLQGFAYQIKKIKTGVEFGYPILVKGFDSYIRYNKDRIRNGSDKVMWFHPNFYTSVFVSEQLHIKKYNFYIKQGVEYHLIKTDEIKKRHVMSLFIGIQLPFTQKI